MENLITQIEGILNENGGAMSYEAVLNAIDYKDRPQLHNALKEAKRRGLFQKHLRWDSEAKQNSLTVELIQAEVEPEQPESA